MTTDPKATPTPQAQAGDADDFGTYEVHIGEAGGDDDCLMVTADQYERLLRAYEALLAQAPARDAGAVAYITERGLQNLKAHGYAVVGNKPQPGAPEIAEFALYTHPAAASDDARDGARYRWLRDTGAVFTVRALGDDGKQVQVCPIGRAAEGLDAAIDAALSSPDGLRKGEGS